jgi:ParB family chromosome partitioning protein
MSAAELSRLAAYFVANPNLTLETALQALEQGAELRQKAAPDVQIAGGPLPKTSTANPQPGEQDDDLWDDDEPPLDDGEYLHAEDDTIENQPANKARVYRLRSLDQMVDETDRLSRAYAEGDLTKWVSRDEDAPFKVRLLLKQLESLAQGLREIARQQGWE